MKDLFAAPEKPIIYVPTVAYRNLLREIEMLIVSIPPEAVKSSTSFQQYVDKILHKYNIRPEFEVFVQEKNNG